MSNEALIFQEFCQRYSRYIYIYIYIRDIDSEYYGSLEEEGKNLR